MLELTDAIRMTAKPLISMYSSLLPELPVWTPTEIGTTRVTCCPALFTPQARTASLCVPGAIVPVSMVRVTLVPLPDPGATLADEKVTAPMPVGRLEPGSASRNRLTFAPNAVPDRRTLTVNVTSSPLAAAACSAGLTDRMKSRDTVPNFTANGWYFIVR